MDNNHNALRSEKLETKMAEVSSEEVVAIEDSASQSTSWSISQTRILINYFKENPILWDRRLKDNGNKTKTKKTMAPLLAIFQNTQPTRQPKEIKSRWHSLRSSVLRYMKRIKEDPEFEIKWQFWEDLVFLRLSLQGGDNNDDQCE